MFGSEEEEVEIPAVSETVNRRPDRGKHEERKKERAIDFGSSPFYPKVASPTWLQNFIALLEHKEGENKASE